jgi:hypothetical protein
MCLLIFNSTRAAPPDSDSRARVLSNVDFQAFIGIDEAALDTKLNGICLDRLAFGDQLIAQIRVPASPEARLAAIFIAGYFRMESTVDELSKIIDLHSPPRRNLKLPLLSEWPVADALVRIGSPALPAMAQNLAQSDDLIVRQQSTKVIIAILGTRLAKNAIQQAADEAKRTGSTREAERLNDATSHIDTAPTTNK